MQVALASSKLETGLPFKTAVVAVSVVVASWGTYYYTAVAIAPFCFVLIAVACYYSFRMGKRTFQLPPF